MIIIVMIIIITIIIIIITIRSRERCFATCVTWRLAENKKIDRSENVPDDNCRLSIHSAAVSFILNGASSLLLLASIPSVLIKRY